MIIICTLTEYKEELAIKLLEEVQEFHSDKNIEELADIIEVFDANKRPKEKIRS
jgi:predicted house-cleaning noncanonical NTP pyrophosphatase (MazG superfamily)